MTARRSLSSAVEQAAAAAAKVAFRFCNLLSKSHEGGRKGWEEGEEVGRVWRSWISTRAVKKMMTKDAQRNTVEGRSVHGRRWLWCLWWLVLVEMVFVFMDLENLSLSPVGCVFGVMGFGWWKPQGEVF